MFRLVVPKINFNIVNKIINLEREEISVPLVSNVIYETREIRSEIIDNYECGETIGSGRAVVVKNGKIYLADYTDEDIQTLPVGVAKSAGETGSTVPVVFSGIVNGYGGLQEGRYFVGSDGVITRQIPSNGIVLEIGRAVANDKLFVDVKLIIRR